MTNTIIIYVVINARIGNLVLSLSFPKNLGACLSALKENSILLVV